jgi:hypothetical protein
MHRTPMNLTWMARPTPWRRPLRAAVVPRTARGDPHVYALTNRLCARETHFSLPSVQPVVTGTLIAALVLQVVPRLNEETASSSAGRLPDEALDDALARHVSAGAHGGNVYPKSDIGSSSSRRGRLSQPAVRHQEQGLQATLLSVHGGVVQPR